MEEKNLPPALVKFDRVFFLVAPLVQYGVIVFGGIWATTIAETSSGPYFNFKGFEQFFYFLYFLGAAGLLTLLTFIWHCISFAIIQKSYNPAWRVSHGKVLYIAAIVSAVIIVSLSFPFIDLLGMLLVVPMLLFMHVWGWVYKFISDKDARGISQTH